MTFITVVIYVITIIKRASCPVAYWIFRKMGLGILSFLRGQNAQRINLDERGSIYYRYYYYDGKVLSSY